MYFLWVPVAVLRGHIDVVRMPRNPSGCPQGLHGLPKRTSRIASGIPWALKNPTAFRRNRLRGF
eukprot:2724315-Pyramimonas_sp.AAC.1